MIHIKIISVWYDIGIKIHFFPYEYQVVSESFVGKSFLSLQNYVGAFITFQLAYTHESVSRLYMLLHGSVCLTTCQYHTEVITVALQQFLKSSGVSPTTLFIFCMLVLATLGPLYFHINFLTALLRCNNLCTINWVYLKCTI